jgi:RND family efflux transporter MFP subunit
VRLKSLIPAQGRNVLFAGCLAMTCAAWAQEATPAAMATPANVVAVVHGDVRQVIPTVGTLAPRKTALMGSQVPGRVDEVFVDVGDAVKAGQELVRLDPKFFQIELDLRQAELQAAQVRADQSRSTFTRHQEISAKNPQAISAQAVDEARSASALALAQLAQAQQALLAAEERLHEAVVRAPFDGVVTERLVDPGDPVTTTFVTQVLKIEQLDRLELLFTLPQEVFGQVQEGTAVQFAVNGVPELAGEGVVDRVFPSLDEATRSFRCRVVFDNPGLRFRPGMLMQVYAVVREAKGVLTAPTGAVFQRGEGDAVRVATEKGFEERTVQVGLRGMSAVEITSGLAEGERVLLLNAAGSSTEAPTQ